MFILIFEGGTLQGSHADSVCCIFKHLICISGDGDLGAILTTSLPFPQKKSGAILTMTMTPFHSLPRQSGEDSACTFTTLLPAKKMGIGICSARCNEMMLNTLLDFSSLRSKETLERVLRGCTAPVQDLPQQAAE